jgi:hypothetical protein
MLDGKKIDVRGRGKVLNRRTKRETGEDPLRHRPKHHETGEQSPAAATTTLIRLRHPIPGIYNIKVSIHRKVSMDNVNRPSLHDRVVDPSFHILPVVCEIHHEFIYYQPVPRPFLPAAYVQLSNSH